MTDLLISLIKIKDRYFPFTKRLIDTPTSDRCDNAKLGKMRSDRIDHRSLLTDEEMARAMEHQAALLFRASSPPRTACSFQEDASYDEDRPSHTAIELFSSRHARRGSGHLYSCTILAKTEGQPRPNAANQSMLCCEDRADVSCLLGGRSASCEHALLGDTIRPLELGRPEFRLFARCGSIAVVASHPIAVWMVTVFLIIVISGQSGFRNQNHPGPKRASEH
jgi:hypothetical protein